MSNEIEDDDVIDITPTKKRLNAEVYNEDEEIIEIIKKKTRMTEAFKSFGEYMDKKIEKLDAQFENEKLHLKSNIFSGVSIHITGHTEPSFTELKKLMQENGGKFYHYFDSKRVTHIVASNLSNSRSKDSSNKKVVKPEWIVKSIEAAKLLPWEEFRLSHQHDLHFSNLGVKDIKSFAQPAGSVAQKSESPLKPNEPGFVKSFFKSSRLHYLSTWKQQIKKYAFRKSTSKTCVIFHVDMDCFFASVAVANSPHLKDKPVAVSHGQGQGGLQSSDIASCNYVARSYGIKNGMLVGKARNLCKDLVIVGYDFELYSKATEDLYSVLQKYPDALEPVSCDEAFLEFSTSEDVEESYPINMRLPYDNDEGEVIDGILGIAKSIQNEVYKKSGLFASIGISSNPLLARVATKHAKPQGIYYLQGKEETQAIMYNFPVSDVPGIGWSYRNRIKELMQRELKQKFDDDTNVVTCGKVLEVLNDVKIFQSEFGPNLGLKIFQSLQGEDSRKISQNITEADSGSDERKTVSVEMNWGVRMDTAEEAENFLRSLITELLDRVDSESFGFVKITLGINFRHRDAPYENPYKYLGCGHCERFTKSIKLSPTESYIDLDKIYNILKAPFRNLCSERINELFKSSDLSISYKEIRGIGITLTREDKTGTKPKTKNEKLNIKLQQRELDRWKKFKKPQKIIVSKKVREFKDEYKNLEIPALAELCFELVEEEEFELLEKLKRYYELFTNIQVSELFKVITEMVRNKLFC